jgi:hypothetical protein
MDARDPAVVHQLFLLNVVLQLFDGIATYHGIATPWNEANPLLCAAMMQLGIGAALLLCKASACAGLVLLRSLAQHPLAGRGLAAIAAVYGSCSFIPWTARNLSLL